MRQFYEAVPFRSVSYENAAENERRAYRPDDRQGMDHVRMALLCGQAPDREQDKNASRDGKAMP
jgi:hypothetical protein